MRSARYVTWLTWRRLRRRGSGGLIAALGLAVATTVLAGVLGGVTIAADRSTSQAIERIPAPGRAVRAVWFGVPASPDEAQPILDRQVREALAGLPLAEPTPLVLVRESTVAGQFIGLAAVDGLAPHVRLRSGRRPRRCTAQRCEVLRLQGRGRLPNAPGLRLVQVGTATLRSRQLFGDFLEPLDNATAYAELAPGFRRSGRYHRPPPAPLVVAEGVAALASSPALVRTYRSYAWVSPLAAGSPRLWQVDQVIDRIERGRAELAARSGSFAVTAPEEELRAAERRANIAGRRLLLVGGEAAALLLAFALLAARSLRRDLGDAHRRLTWYGARRSQLALMTGIESAVVAGGGVLVGWAVGSAAGAAAARMASAPAVPVLLESVAAPRGIAMAVACALVATGLIALVVSVRPPEGARLGVPEVVGSAALLVIGVILVGGAVDEERLAQAEGPAMLLLLLPGLVALVAAIVVARLFPPLAQLVADRSRGPLSLRLGATGLARGPGAAVVTVAFLTIAFALALLAEGYRATLARGEREQAAFQVPLDVVVREDLSALVRVFDAASLGRFRSLGGEGSDAYPVLRVSGGAGRTERISGVTVLGLDRGVVEQLAVWRSEWAGGAGREELADMIGPGFDVRLRTAALPAGEIVLRVGPSLLSFAAVVETPTGDFRRIELGAADPAAPSTLRASVPRRSRLASLELVPPPRLIEGGADAGIAFDGVVHVEGALARELQTWIGVDGVNVRPLRSAGMDLRYVLTPQRTGRLRARQVTDKSPPATLVTRRLAELAGGVGGLISVQIGGAQVPVLVAGVVDRFPGASEEAVIGDRATLRTAINAAAPGAARENEVWLDLADERLPVVMAALTRAPFRVLSSTARSDLEEDARRDPLAQGTLLALGAGSLVALVLAAIGLALAVRSDLRDDRSELYDLEAQGASPALLRQVVRLRALALTIAGLLAGGATGLVLVMLVTRVVAVTARGGFAEPPLATEVDPVVVIAGAAAFAALAVLLVGSTTRRAFAGGRGPQFRSED
jgi:FtsX-like permease family protein